jgi:hypothetical protein
LHLRVKGEATTKGKGYRNIIDDAFIMKYV